MDKPNRWRKEAGPRLQGSRDLDLSKVQAPSIVRIPSGGFRLFYTAIGPAKPYRTCQGYILSAVSADGLAFQTEPGIRLAPQPTLPHMSLRVLAPSVTRCADGRWRMYFESRGSADQPAVICSAFSSDMLHWEHEEGIRLQSSGGVGGPRYLPLAHGGGRLYCCLSKYGTEESEEPVLLSVPNRPPIGPEGKSGVRLSYSAVSAITSDGLDFRFEPGHRMRDRQTECDSAGITAAAVIPPRATGENWTMFFSAWQDVPPGTVVPMHPSQDVDAVTSGSSEDFAAASIASDMAGYRSRIFSARSSDGMEWERVGCVIEGAGYDGEGLDAVHAEDMSLVRIADNKYRMYYAACDRRGDWRIASAVWEDATALSSAE